MSTELSFRVQNGQEIVKDENFASLSSCILKQTVNMRLPFPYTLHIQTFQH